jgi:VanZ family protein
MRRAGLFLSALAALAADYPFADWQDHPHWANVAWVPFASPPVRPVDIALNMLLFAPLGFFAGLHARSTVRAAALAVAIGLPVSLLGEWTQVYSHSRFPSATDVCSNMIGAVVAAMIAALVLPPP